MKKQILFFVLVGLIICFMLILDGCGDNPKPSCTGKEEVKAKFTIGEKYLGLDSAVVTDTTITGNSVVFEASEDYDSYDWKIGEDARSFNTKKVALLFLNPEAKVDIRLIVKKRPNKDCFPKDDGIDTLVKSFTVIDRKLNPVIGEFEGSNQSNPNDIFKIKTFYYLPGDYYSLSLVNINKGCNPDDNITGTKAFQIGILYRKFYFNADYLYSNSCKDPKGWATIDKTGKTIEINYTYDDGPNISKYFKEKYIGKKIN